MTRFNPPRASERISRILLQMAVLVGVMFWVSERDNGSSASELEDAKVVHAEMQTLRAERDLLRSDIWALREQLGQAERDRDLAQDQVDQLRLNEMPTLVAMVPAAGSHQGQTAPNPRAVSLPAAQKAMQKATPTEDPKAPMASDLMVIPVAMIEAPRSDEVELIPEPIEWVSLAPSLGEFHSGKRGSKKLSLAEEADLRTVELEDFQPAFDRSRAEGMWQEALAEASDSECRRQRGLARSRCESEITQSLEPYSALAIQCIMSGNARPDYVQGVATNAVPSHGVSLEQGAIILCDAELANH